MNFPVEAAKYSFGLHNSDSIKKVVNEALNEELYCDEFAEISINNQLNWAELASLFEAGLKKFKTTVPTTEEALWALLKYYIGEIGKQHQNDPLRGLDDLIQNTYWHYDFHSKSKEYLGDSHGIEKLIGIYFEIDDIISKPEQFIQKHENQEKLKIAREEAVVEARNWLNKLKNC